MVRWVREYSNVHRIRQGHITCGVALNEEAALHVTQHDAFRTIASRTLFFFLSFHVKHLCFSPSFSKKETMSARIS